METAHWRLLKTPPGEGSWNMAVDEAILEAVGSQAVLPTLRLFAWDPPCLSLGYAQPIGDVDRQALADLGWRLVRRPTGGRAILHTDELTYSVIAPLHEPRVAGSVLESYSRLAQSLLLALHILALPAQAQPAYGASGRSQNPICFEVPSNYEITVDGKKLIGSAQARRREGVLQHGSLPLVGDLTRITRVLSFTNESQRLAAASRLMEHAITVEMVLHQQVSWDQAAAAFETAFCQALDLTFEPAALSSGELQRADDLVAQKYGHPVWTDRV
jgi:lipoyl(octanoyl) transferase